MTIGHWVAHADSMQPITASTVGHVIKSVHDMQHVLTHGCMSPSFAQPSVHTSDGMQLNAISHAV